MFTSLRNLVGGRGSRVVGDSAAHEESEFGGVRYRPLLVNHLTQGHEDLLVHMRSVLAACSRRDESGLIAALRKLAGMFRALALLKSVQLYPYVRWGLRQDDAAQIVFNAVFLEAQRDMRAVESVLSEYLGAPWDTDHRRRVVADVSRAARHLAAGIRRDETSVIALYMPPGQYRYVGIPDPGVADRFASVGKSTQ